ncbi:ATP-dependent RNA helicase DBP2-like [Maniola jurtina]|uniref:ATP-dependent RNA helicase DBP2-like n=1 Tax=Maniola jurtina TaxID=191418 RepID=UPI001E68B0DC|nr:ATP-dependent RNA helicase DBP2-like [Maniola jurtina]
MQSSVMALNIAKKFMRRNDLVKLLYQNGKQLLHSKTCLFTINHESFYSTLARIHFEKQFKFGRRILNSHFYSVKTAHESDAEYHKEHNITIVGDDVPSPYKDIDNSYFPDYIKEFLNAQGFTKPTVIQAQGWPIAIAGKNFVGIAQTGTGKTLAYLLPAVIQLKEKAARKGRGPRVLVLAPTRELARQIEEVAKEFQTLFNIRCLCIYGGVSRIPQMEALRNGVDILIATPGRLNDFLDSKVTNLSRCGYVVLDEADRMLDMGFEPQIRQALEGVPLERQILMFSATWPKEVQHLAKDYLGDFVQVNVGSTELSANHNIKQHIHVCEQEEKMDKFKSIMHEISGEGFGKVLVFTNTKRFVDSLTLSLKRNGWPAVGIHGDKSQLQRDITINKFRSGATNVLVATDVAARGLDVDGVTHVINYDFPNTSEDYIHRIGRTGRLQNKGVAHTILTTEDARQAKSLIAVLKEAKQEIPKELEDLANDYKSLKINERQSRFSQKKPWAPKKWNKFRSNSYNRY